MAMNAIVTGSTSGIGLGIATSLASAGCNVIINGLGDADLINDTIALLKQKSNSKILHSSADMKKPEEISNMIEYCINEFGSIDILVNNAGIQYVSPVEDLPQKQWDDIIAINLSAAFYSIKASLPHMRKNNFGRIINIASTHGLVASPNKSAYVAAKHGLVGLTKVVALEAAESNITCNAICPGWVCTPLVQKQIDAIAINSRISQQKASEQLLSSKHPNKRFVKVEDIGAFVNFLSSDHAGSMTGEILSMDGGWTAQ